MEPARVVRCAELGRIPRKDAVRRPLRQPLLALLQRREVEVEVRGRHVRFGAVGMGEVEAVGMDLARLDAGELDVLRDAVRLALLAEKLGAHVALGAYLVYSAAHRHDARPVAGGSNPVLEATSPLRGHIGIVAYRRARVDYRRHAGEDCDASAALRLQRLRVFLKDSPVLVRLVGEVVAVLVEIGQVLWHTLVPEATEALHVPVHHDILALEPDFAEAEEELAAPVVARRAREAHVGLARVEFRPRHQLPRLGVLEGNLDIDRV